MDSHRPLRLIRWAWLLLFFALPAWAQFTLVSGTVTDPNGLPYAYGTITPALTSSGTPTLNGLPYSPPNSPVGLNASGTFQFQLAANASLLPASSTWSFTVKCGVGCVLPSGGNGPVSFTLSGVTIAGTTQNISSQLSALAPALSNGSGNFTNPTAATASFGGGVVTMTTASGNWGTSFVVGATISVASCSAGGDNSPPTFTIASGGSGTNTLTYSDASGAAATGCIVSAVAPTSTPPFNLVQSGTNAGALLISGTLAPTGGGTIQANLLNTLSSPFVGTNGSGTPIQAACTAAFMLVGNSSNLAVCQALSGDSIISNTGVMTNKGLNGVLLSSLATGPLCNTSSSGVPFICLAGNYPTLNQNTTGNAATATTASNTTAVNGAAVPASASVLGSNSSSQPIAQAPQTVSTLLNGTTLDPALIGQNTNNYCYTDGTTYANLLACVNYFLGNSIASGVIYDNTPYDMTVNPFEGSTTRAPTWWLGLGRVGTLPGTTNPLVWVTEVPLILPAGTNLWGQGGLGTGYGGNQNTLSAIMTGSNFPTALGSPGPILPVTATESSNTVTLTIDGSRTSTSTFPATYTGAIVVQGCKDASGNLLTGYNISATIASGGSGSATLTYTDATSGLSNATQSCFVDAVSTITSATTGGTIPTGNYLVETGYVNNDQGSTSGVPPVAGPSTPSLAQLVNCSTSTCSITVTSPAATGTSPFQATDFYIAISAVPSNPLTCLTAGYPCGVGQEVAGCTATNTLGKCTQVITCGANGVGTSDPIGACALGSTATITKFPETGDAMYPAVAGGAFAPPVADLSNPEIVIGDNYGTYQANDNSFGTEIKDIYVIAGPTYSVSAVSASSMSGTGSVATFTAASNFPASWGTQTPFVATVTVTGCSVSAYNTVNSTINPTPILSGGAGTTSFTYQSAGTGASSGCSATVSTNPVAHTPAVAIWNRTGQEATLMEQLGFWGAFYGALFYDTHGNKTMYRGIEPFTNRYISDNGTPFGFNELVADGCYYATQSGVISWQSGSLNYNPLGNGYAPSSNIYARGCTIPGASSPGTYLDVYAPHFENWLNLASTYGSDNITCDWGASCNIFGGSFLSQHGAGIRRTITGLHIGVFGVPKNGFSGQPDAVDEARSIIIQPSTTSQDVTYDSTNYIAKDVILANTFTTTGSGFNTIFGKEESPIISLAAIGNGTTATLTLPGMYQVFPAGYTVGATFAVAGCSQSGYNTSFLTPVTITAGGAGTQTISYANATTAAATGCQVTLPGFGVEPNVNYHGWCDGLYKMGGASTIPAFQLIGPASPTAVELSETATLTQGVGASIYSASTGNITSFPATLSPATGTYTTATDLPVHLDWYLQNGANAGSLQVQANANSNTLTIEKSFNCHMEPQLQVP
jgi:hypothetical protein